MQYFKSIGDKIECLLCRHHCKLKEGQVGICGINMNKNGKLVNLVYGHPSSINIDPIEKNLFFIFYQVVTYFHSERWDVILNVLSVKIGKSHTQIK